jgi:hypothetical protein
LEISRGAAFTSGVVFGVIRVDGPPFEVGAGVVSGFFSGVGVAATWGVAEACGIFCPGGRLPVGFGVGFPPGPVGGPPSVPAGFTVGEAPGVPAGLTPSRFGGTGFFPAAAALGEALGVTFAFGELAPGFNKLGGVFGPATAGGEPVAPGVPVTFPLLPICGFTKGVGFGRFFGGGFCSAMVFLSFSAS